MTREENTPELNGNNKTFQINGWKVEPLSNYLKTADEEIRIEPRLMSLLVYLAENQGETLTRENLLDTVWEDCNVSLETLNSSISRLRKILGDTEKEKKYIETIPKVGYRLIMPVDFNGQIENSVSPVAENKSKVQDISRQTVKENVSERKSNYSRKNILVFSIIILLIAAFSIYVFWIMFSPKNETTENIKPKRILPLTSYKGIEKKPAFSRGENDERIAFAWQGENNDNWDIYVQTVGMEKPMRLTSDEGSDDNPVWSPDNRFIAFTRIKDEKCEIRQIPALGGVEKKLTDCSVPETPSLSWSFDGKWLAFPHRESLDKPFHIRLFSFETSETKVLTTPPENTFGDVNVSFSPIENSLAFLRMPVLGVEDAWTIGIEGGEPFRLTKDNLKIHGIDWTPDGKKLVFSSNRSGIFSLWQISAKGENLQWVEISNGEADNPTISGSGEKIAYEQWQVEANIYEIDLNKSTDSPEELVVSTRWDWNPSYSADASEITFLSDRSGFPEVWIADKSGKNLSQLTSFKGTMLGFPNWSPDKKEIVFDARVDGNADVWVVDRDKKSPRRITEDSSEEIAPTFSRDGRWIYFSSNKSGEWQIWKVSTDKGEPIQVTKNGGVIGKESANGKYVYFTHPQKKGIWQVPTNGGDETILTNELKPMDRTNWAILDDKVYFINRPISTKAVLKSYAITSKKTEQIGEVDNFLLRSGLTISNDGKSILFSRIDRIESDLMIAEK